MALLVQTIKYFFLSAFLIKYYLSPNPLKKHAVQKKRSDDSGYILCKKTMVLWYGGMVAWEKMKNEELGKTNENK